MPRNKDLKRLVRTRMGKTGESYTAARSQLVGRPVRGTRTTRDLAAIAGMSDDAVKARTGRTWKQWATVLDKAKAASMPHRDIARHLHDVEGVPGWWAQTVTVGYERIRGLREKGQKSDGSYSVNKSKTFAVPVSTLYRTFSARARKRWLGDVRMRVKTSTVDKSMRITWDDGTPVDVTFWKKRVKKAQVQLQHRGLAGKADAARVREDWTGRLAALGEVLAE
ncbi:MAG: hypothetical protein ACYTG2_13235 [Planctomycetota bacterium]